MRASWTVFVVGAACVALAAWAAPCEDVGWREEQACVNLLSNGGFEDGGNSGKGWTASANMRFKAAQGRGGSRAAVTRKVTGNWTEPLLLEQLVTTKQEQPGFMYMLAAWIRVEMPANSSSRADATATVQLGLSMLTDSESVHVGLLKHNVSTDGEFHLLRTAFMPADLPESVHVSVIVPPAGAPAGATVAVDDVTLVAWPMETLVPDGTDTIKLALYDRPEHCAYEIEANVFMPSEAHQPFQITACLDALHDHVQTLVWFAEAWTAPMSITLFASTRAIAHRVAQLMRSNSPAMSRWAAIHLAYGTAGYAEDCLVPTGVMRQTSVKAATTEYVLSVPADVICSADAHTQILNDIHGATIQEENPVWVVPTFQTKHAQSYPKTKPDAVEMLMAGTLEPLHFRDRRTSQFQTNTWLWTRSTTPDAVTWTPGYEPYVVVPRVSSPAFDDDLDGHAPLQAMYIHALAADQVSFRALPSVYLVHVRHAKTPDQERFDVMEHDFLEKRAQLAAFA